MGGFTTDSISALSLGGRSPWRDGRYTTQSNRSPLCLSSTSVCFSLYLLASPLFSPPFLGALLSSLRSCRSLAPTGPLPRRPPECLTAPRPKAPPADFMISRRFSFPPHPHAMNALSFLISIGCPVCLTLLFSLYFLIPLCFHQSVTSAYGLHSISLSLSLSLTLSFSPSLSRSLSLSPSFPFFLQEPGWTSAYHTDFPTDAKRTPPLAWEVTL